jgi:hypothetical protein
MNTCPYCEVEDEIEIQEIWPDLREFNLTFCCERSQHEWLELSSHQPRKDWTKLFREQAGLGIRGIIPGIDDVLRQKQPLTELGFAGKKDCSPISET